MQRLFVVSLMCCLSMPVWALDEQQVKQAIEDAKNAFDKAVAEQGGWVSTSKLLKDAQLSAAKGESVNTILNAVALKKENKLKKVIVAGCLSERYREDLLNEIPEVDVYFGTEDYSGIISELGGAIPLMRGRHKSKPIDELVKEATFLASGGAKEIVLIAQDTTDYGIDLYEKRNPDFACPGSGSRPCGRHPALSVPAEN